MPVGTIVHRLESVDSTNDAARDLALAGAAHGTAVVAEEQTRGRGTKGRAWHSPPGLGLYASFILRGPAAGPFPPFTSCPWPRGWPRRTPSWPRPASRSGSSGRTTSSMTGRSSAASCPRASPAERTADFAVVGVGINVGHGPADFPADLRASSTSLRLIGAGR